jgi:FlaA1/EpsC-like NDP-sugar epimerase
MESTLNSNRQRKLAKLLLDLVIWVLALPLALFLRTDSMAASDYTQDMAVVLLVTLPFKAAALWMLGLFRQSWRRVSMDDLIRLSLAVVSVAVVTYVVLFVGAGEVRLPRSVPLLEAMLAVAGMSIARVTIRFEKERIGKISANTNGKTRSVLIAGAGDAGSMMAREMRRNPDKGLIPVGFLDDDTSKHRTRVAGVPVVGPLARLKAAARVTGADEVLIAMPSADGETVRRVVEQARENGLGYRILPAIHDLISGVVSISQIRPVNLEDLLRRDPVQLETTLIRQYVTGRRVLVTGAGGSIGSEIVRQIARFDPRCIVLLGRGENSVFLIEQEMRRSFGHVEVHPVIADVRDMEKLDQVFGEYRPEVVFHAAAHKHVPLMEANPDQAVFNNVGGTRNLVTLALEYGVERLVNVSTDKAVNPTSVMGASKRTAELVVRQAAARCQPHQHFVSVRFGNVLGSRGSVVPFFQKQIARGGPVTVTHEDMIRYFMTIPEAAQLVLQAGGMDTPGAVYVLDMGQPVKIIDLARDLILLSGLEPGRDIEIQVTGMRPGEKLYEELLTAEEGTVESQHEKIFVAPKKEMAAGAFEPLVDRLFEAAAQRDGLAIRRAFLDLIPTARFELLLEEQEV